MDGAGGFYPLGWGFESLQGRQCEQLVIEFLMTIGAKRDHIGWVIHFSKQSLVGKFGHRPDVCELYVLGVATSKTRL